ncbi:MAG: sulfotransferase [Phycisphaeraceae bacterium]|nr:sulfotransferase [Phycisphaeraceae bacterium]
MRMKHLVLAAPRNIVMGALWPLERSLLRRDDGAEKAPAVFIVGPPRSGTTLVYEAMVGTMRFAYISNLAHRLYRVPAAASRLGAGILSNYQPQYESKWGHVSGWAAPNEGGWVWERWFPAHDESESAEPSRGATGAMCRTIGAMCRVMGGPFLNKNVNHSVWIPYLARVLPRSIFIEVDRDVVATARSMLKARCDELGDAGVHEWISVKPRGWHAFARESPETQCVAQNMLLKRQINEDCTGIDPARRIVVPYERFCDDPAGWLDEVRSRLAAAGVRVEQRGAAPLPFARRGEKSSDDIASRLRDAVDLVESRLRASPMPVGVPA